MKIRAALLVVSDSVSRGERKDENGEIAREVLGSAAEVVEKRIVPDEPDQVRAAILRWCDEQEVDVVVTIGGTGLSPRDVTAEVTRTLIEKEASGISTALLMQGLRATPRAMLSNAAAGVRGRTLIINLPGSTSAVRESLEYLRDVLPHAVEMIWGAGHDTAANG